MSLSVQPIPSVPEATACVAKAAFPHGNLCLQLRDALGTIYDDSEFAALFPDSGQPAHSPWQLALASTLQFVEGLSDRQAAESVRSRIDLKYLLSLELSDPGFDSTVLYKFRARLVTGGRITIAGEIFSSLHRPQPVIVAGPHAHRFDTCLSRRSYS